MNASVVWLALTIRSLFYSQSPEREIKLNLMTGKRKKGRVLSVFRQ